MTRPRPVAMHSVTIEVPETLLVAGEARVRGAIMSRDELLYYASGLMLSFESALRRLASNVAEDAVMERRAENDITTNNEGELQ